MARLAEALAFVMPEAEILRFPAWDCLPYDRVSPNPALVAERIATLTRLLEQARRPAHRADHGERRWCSACRRAPPSPAPAWRSPSTARSQPEKLAAFLEANGYGRAGTVMEPGEYAMRGGIIDMFPAGEPDPVRLDLFGDTIEIDPRLRPGHPAQRRQTRQACRCARSPKCRSTRQSIARFRTAWRELFGQDAADDPMYLSISDGRRHPGMEHWVPLFHADDGNPARLPARTPPSASTIRPRTC